MQNRDGLEQFGCLIGTASSGFWTPGRTVVDPSIPYLPLENPIGGGGGATVTPGFGELTATGFAPTIQTPITVRPAFGELTLAGFLPTIQFPVTVTPAAGALQLDGYLPTIQTPLTVTPDMGALTLVGFEPTIQFPVTVQPAVGALTLEGFAPTISIPLGGRRFYVWQPWPEEKKHPSPPKPAEPEGFSLPVPQTVAGPPERPPEPGYIGEPEEVAPAPVPVWLQRIAAGGSGLSRRVAAALESAQAVVVRRQEAQRRRERQVRRNEQDIQDVEDLLRTLDEVDQI
jgi:hypothetical protein